MRRWNGWGDEAVTYSVHKSAAAFLKRLLGPGSPPKDASVQDALSHVPKSKLPRHPLISTDIAARLTHARGQSLPDWIDLRTGRINSFPDGVAYPQSKDDVSNLLQYSQRNGIHVIPYGGGTSVVGHINPVKSRSPVYTIDMSRMNQLVELNAKSSLATFQAGVTGPDLEAQLRAHGFTLGHYPQSFEYSSLGGWVATRSSGQQSLGYGRIEKLFAGGSLATPRGEMNLPCFPASAAGPDLREIVLGSEGRLGILTEACVRVSPVPEHEEFHAVFFPDFEHGIEANRQILASGISLSMLRLSTANETITTLALAGHDTLIATLERLLSLRGLGKDKCMLLLGFSGKSSLLHVSRGEAFHLTSNLGAVNVGRTFGNEWNKNRFRTPYLRNTLWEMGYGVDTLETAIEWSIIPQMVDRIEAALQAASAEFDEKVHVFTHLSHVYPYGSSVYTTFIFRLSQDPDKTLDHWKAMKTAASQAIVALGGTISHHHGIGTAHLAYLPSEKGPMGMAVLSAIQHEFDPKGIMNPGKLIP